MDKKFLKPNIKLNISEIPYKRSLSFLPLIKQLKNEVEQGGMYSSHADYILSQIKNYPIFFSESIKPEELLKYEEQVQIVMSYIYSPIEIENSMSEVGGPFEDETFFHSKIRKELLNNKNKVFTLIDDVSEDKCMLLFSKLMYAYLIILKEFYQFNISMAYLIRYHLVDKLNGLVNYFKFDYDSTYIEIKHKGDLKKLSDSDIKKLINHPFDMDLWLEMLPLDQFEFSGFMKYEYIDVTHLEVISSLKTDLLEKSSIINPNNFKNLEQNIRSLFQNPNLCLGIVALNMKQGNMQNRSDLWNGLLCSSSYTCSDYKGSIYEEALKKEQPIIINDLSKHDKIGTVEKAILSKGINNIALTPLIFENQLVGILEIGSPNAYDFNFTNLRTIKDLIPVFSIALMRSSNELQTHVQATIKEECTAIHPSVEWRFEEAAYNLIQEREVNENAKMEEIVFEQVHPLYGAIDIRNSSHERNHSIQCDLIEQLKLAKKVFQEAYRLKQMPIYDQVIYKIEQYSKRIVKGLSSGDESNILNFIQDHVDPLFMHFNFKDKQFKEAITKYKESLDPELNIIYKRRKDFEDSLAMINSCIIQCLDKEQEKAQQMYPHYFEKYRTDGVEHNIYLGEAITQNQDYNPMYLKNLRLWQLIISCEMSRRTAELKASLPIPLDTTALILVHPQKLSIRFRQDEKKFDVDGAYNIRYEIVKKRIDKAVIKGTNERLTQAGKLSIIFSQGNDMFEYQRYLEYLIAKDYFEDNIENLILDDLQGVYGLRALRVTIKNSNNNQENITELAQEIGLNG
ncbi:GAF domain-containing protein [Ancylomarina euxinus]|uniref:GAF domain-containing protein n=1 Tax=Ancylomarina euxinus TaxID=2283627 RepID=A0A425XY84_9BACT|nr:GAF domain-containing protein [Ancylomarina euxinus]MCZ4695966.1 GAF domain-containing protein [Ancylomarina euxinus]MUP16338.1 GAF domain-containing protein [Ancylomarina euxinus]RRG19732.1 GAF domain-containing protein [Ancylomarina euxinus]